MTPLNYGLSYGSSLTSYYERQCYYGTRLWLYGLNMGYYGLWAYYGLIIELLLLTMALTMGLNYESLTMRAYYGANFSLLLQLEP